VHHTDARLQEMCSALRALGAQVNDSEIPDIEHCGIDEASTDDRTSSADKR
jgi:serine O-acetyltransferase